MSWVLLERLATQSTRQSVEFVDWKLVEHFGRWVLAICDKERKRLRVTYFHNAASVSELYKICADRALIRLAEASERPQDEEAIGEHI